MLYCFQEKETGALQFSGEGNWYLLFSGEGNWCSTVFQIEGNWYSTVLRRKKLVHSALLFTG